MISQQSQVEKSLQTILRDQPINTNMSLSQLLPEPIFSKKSDQIKKNYADFIQSCLTNNKLIKQMIDRGVKNDVFNQAYQKKLALFSLDILSGDLGDSHKLFIKLDDQDSKSLRRSKSIKNQCEIEQQIQGQAEKSKQQTIEKYQNFVYLLEYIKRPVKQISAVCMNYFSKIMTSIVSNRAEHVYAYFAKQKSQNDKTDLQYLIQMTYNFGGVSQMLGKMIAEQGPTNKYLHIKKQIIQGVIKMLKNEQLIKKNSENYQYVLDFVTYVFSRTKYKSDDKAQEINRICQRFVDQDVVWFYKQKIIKAVTDSKNMNSSFLTNSGSLKSIPISNKNDIRIQPQLQQQARNSQIIFQNSIQFLKILAERLNSQQQVDPYSYTYSQEEKQKNAQPSMDFQVNQIIFGANSLYQLMTLPIPYRYKNINKMSYYEFLLKLTRNSRFKDTKTSNVNGIFNKINQQHQMGLLQSSLVPILTHLLIMFRREFQTNGLTNFFIQQIITQAILPRITKLQNKQAIMVLSALNPTEQLLKKQDTRVYCNKIFIMLQKKYKLFYEHFNKIGVDVQKIMSGYTVKLGLQPGDANPLQGKKYTVKQFQFIEQQKKVTGTKQISKPQTRLKSQKYEDDDSSSSSSEEEDKQFKKRSFGYPSNQKQLIGVNSNNQFKNQNKNLVIDSEDVEEGLLRKSDKEEQTIKPLNEKQERQKLMELLLDSGGENSDNEEQVARQNPLKKNKQQNQQKQKQT